MPKTVIPSRTVALLEANYLLAEGILPPIFEGLRFGKEIRFLMPTTDGSPEKEVFRQVSLMDGGGKQVGFLEYATDPLFGRGCVLISVGLGEGTIRGRELGKEAKSLEGKQEEFLSYSYPKVGFKDEGTIKDEVTIRDVFSSEVVPDFPAAQMVTGAIKRRRPDPERRNLTPDEATTLTQKFKGEKLFWEPFRKEAANLKECISVALFKSVVNGALQPGKPEVHRVVTESLAPDQGLSLFPQMTNNWCVAASAQSLLDFYRYRYSQAVLAYALKLGSIGNSQPLFPSGEYTVVEILESFTRNSLRGKMSRLPTWFDFRDEIQDRKPAIGFIPGHCRLVIGASATTATVKGVQGSALALNGLALLDPYPPGEGNGAVICWENFDSISYQVIFGARVRHLSERKVGLEKCLQRRANALLAAGSNETISAVERFKDPGGDSRGWLASIESGGKVVGLFRFGEDLSCESKYDIKDGLFLNRKTARQEILKGRNGAGDSVQKLELLLSGGLSPRDDSKVMWQAETSGAEAEPIRVGEVTIAPAQIATTPTALVPIPEKEAVVA